MDMQRSSKEEIENDELESMNLDYFSIKNEKVEYSLTEIFNMPDLDFPKLQELYSTGILDIYKNVKMTINDAISMEEILGDKINGILLMAPKVCQGDDCRTLRVCPLGKNNKALPIGQLCPYERLLILEWFKSWLDEYSIDKRNPSDLLDIQNIITANLIQFRANAELAVDGSLVKTEIKGLDAQGNPIEQLVVHPSIQIIEKMSNMGQKHLKNLKATRKDRLDDRRIKDTESSLIEALLSIGESKVPKAIELDSGEKKEE